MIGALARLLGMGAGEDAVSPKALRWVVLDCESSGLDPDRDRLLSLGAVAVREGRIDHAESFNAVLRQSLASEAPNILVHGIGADAQLGGQDPDSALAGFERYAGDSPAVAYHAAFDQALLRRAMPDWRPRWLDLAQLAPVLFQAHAKSCRSLDDWLAAFAIPHPERHDALADAYASAQLLLVLLAEAERQGLGEARDLFAAERSRRWLG
ncbi:MAG: 3'-5' exonuclease [Betaproteobacteria bacterium]